jgi:hypothetical protein
MFDIVEANYITVFIATVLYVVVMMLWYNPKFLGKIWAESHGFDGNECKSSALCLIPGFFIAFVIAWVYGAALASFGIRSIAHAVEFGFWMWLGFVVTTQLSGVFWAKKPLKAYFIDITGVLAGLIVMGLVFGILG